MSESNNIQRLRKQPSAYTTQHTLNVLLNQQNTLSTQMNWIIPTLLINPSFESGMDDSGLNQQKLLSKKVNDATSAASIQIVCSDSDEKLQDVSKPALGFDSVSQLEPNVCCLETYFTDNIAESNDVSVRSSTNLSISE